MPKLILVEDDKTMLSLLTTLLMMEGFELANCDLGSEEKILEGIRQVQPDLVLLDVNLHQANGLEVLRKLRVDPEIAAVRILMSSGMDFRRECLAAGANGFIMKPYMPDDLITHIRKTLTT